MKCFFDYKKEKKEKTRTDGYFMAIINPGSPAVCIQRCVGMNV